MPGPFSCDGPILAGTPCGAGFNQDRVSHDRGKVLATWVFAAPLLQGGSEAFPLLGIPFSQLRACVSRSSS